REDGQLAEAGPGFYRRPRPRMNTHMGSNFPRAPRQPLWVNGIDNGPPEIPLANKFTNLRQWKTTPERTNADALGAPSESVWPLAPDGLRHLRRTSAASRPCRPGSAACSPREAASSP